MDDTLYLSTLFVETLHLFAEEKNSSQTVRESNAFRGILDRFKNRGIEALKPWCFKFHTIISLWKTPVLKASLHDFRSFGPHCLILAFVISRFCVSSYLFWPPSPPETVCFTEGRLLSLILGEPASLKKPFPDPVSQKWNKCSCWEYSGDCTTLLFYMQGLP